MVEIKTYVYFYRDVGGCLLLEDGTYLLLEDNNRLALEASYAWVLCPDALMDPGPRWEYGLPGNGVMDLVASTGILTLTLDNSGTNSQGLAGYYSPGHPNCPAWFTDGLPVKVIVERQDTWAQADRFIGEIVGIRPSSGLFEAAVTEVEAHDWMEQVSIQKIGQLAIQTSKRADEALTTALAQFAIQPTATSFGIGDETFDSIFVTDDAIRMSMASLFQKLARNELGGHIYLQGDGALVFNERSYRPGVTAAAFSLDATTDHPMTELDVAWLRQDIKNRIECKCFPSRVDAAATTVIWKLQQTFPLLAGASITLTCPFRDPDTGMRISAIDVVNPLVSATHIKFGSVDDGATNDLIGSLTRPMTVGANSAKIVLTNTGGTDGFVNFLEIVGKGIYIYEPMVMSDEDSASILAKGERVLPVNLELISDPNRAQAYATLLLGLLVDPHASIDRVTFLANYCDAFATAALTVDPNVRFAIVEPQTGINAHFFVCRIRYEVVGPQLWVTIVPAQASALNYLTFDVDGHGLDEGVLRF